MLSFLHPDWFWLLAALPVLALAKWRADVRGERAVGLVVAARLRHALVRGRSPGRSWAIFGLQLAGLAFLAVTLARPRLGEEKRELKETGRNILIALDTSRSMLATDTMNPADVKPDRLTRAKLAAQDLLALLPGDRVGLVAFAGQAYLQAPLTTDHDAVIETIQSVDHTSVPRGGTDLRKALQVAMETFEKSPARNHGLIIFSDGGDPDPELVAMARRAAEKRILILAVGVGSDAGSDIPDPDAGQTSAYLRGNGNPALAQDNRPRVRDENGNVVISKLESAVLQQLAAATGGSFFKLGSRPLTRGLVASLLATLDQQQASAREETKPIERFQWPLTLAIILLMIAWLIRPKRGGAPLAPGTAAALLVLATPVPGSAEILATSSTEGRASDAPRAYEQGLFEVARDIYARLKGEKSEPEKRHELAYGLGASSLKLKDYDRAVSAFSEALESESAEVQHRSHRGLGHALYDQGDKTLAKQPQFTLKAWTDAIRHFEAALKIEGEDKEVRENLDFVKSRIKELKAQIEQQQQKQQKQQGGKKGDKKEDGT